MLCPACDAIRFPSVVARRTDTPSGSSAVSKKKDVAANARSKGADTQWPAVVPQIDAGRKHSTDKTSTGTNAMNTVSTDLDDSTSECCPCCLDVVDEECIRCDVCKSKIHQTCSGMNHNVYKTLQKIIHQSFWVCGQCRVDLQGCRAAVGKINEELADMRTYVDKLSSELNELKKINADKLSPDRTLQASSSQPAVNVTAANKSVLVNNDQAKLTVEINRTVRDFARRRKNVIISGLPEPNLSTDADNKVADETAFNELCEMNLPVKPALGPMGCRRLGRLGHDRNRPPRRLLVQLTSEENASSLLAVAKQLRTSTDQYVAASVYINRDLSPEEEKEAYEKRQRRRARKHDGDNNQHDTAAQVTPSSDIPDAATPTSSFTKPSETVVSTVPPTYQPSDTSIKLAEANTVSSTPTADPSSVSTPFRV